MSGRMINCGWAVLRGTEVAVNILKPFVHVLIPECMNNTRVYEYVHNVCAHLGVNAGDYATEGEHGC